MDDITIIASCKIPLPCAEDYIVGYKVVAGAEFNQYKSVDLPLGTWRAKSISSGVVGQWTDGKGKLVGI